MVEKSGSKDEKKHEVDEKVEVKFVIFLKLFSLVSNENVISKNIYFLESKQEEKCLLT